MRPIDADALINEIKKETQKVIKQDDKVGSFWLGYIAGLVIKQPTIQPEVLACGNGELIAKPELTDEQVIDYCGKKGYKIVADDLFDLLSKSEPQWIPVSERLPSKEERKEWIDNNLDGIGYLYPCLVTRYSSINPDRTKNNLYVAKHYFDGEDFLNAGEEVCSEYIIAWMPLPKPFEGEGEQE